MGADTRREMGARMVEAFNLVKVTARRCSLRTRRSILKVKAKPVGSLTSASCGARVTCAQHQPFLSHASFSLYRSMMAAFAAAGEAEACLELFNM